MAMNDEETVALIGGGHTFGKTHGARRPSRTRGRSLKPPTWKHRAWAGSANYGTGSGKDAVGSGLEVTWTQTPAQWSNFFFENLFKYEWVQTKSPAGAIQWEAKDADAHHPRRARSVKEAQAYDADHRLVAAPDPLYEKISRRFLEHPQVFADAFPARGSS